jgi:transglutaminase-like putative cysteine protease
MAVTLCRCKNIPARYCTVYLGDIGVPKDPAPMDFSAWFEVFLDGRWFTFDARHNVAPVSGGSSSPVGGTRRTISTQFGNAVLARFDVVTEEVGSGRLTQAGHIPEWRHSVHYKFTLAAGTEAVDFGSNRNGSARCALSMEVDRADTQAHYVSQRPRFTGQGPGARFTPAT